MRSILYLVRRNVALFRNNKLNILLSAASIPIVICLYVFFLRDFLMEMVGRSGIDALYIKQFTDRMVFAGLLVVINTTTCFGIIQICVNDTAAGIRKDFLSAPVTRFSMLSGYWIAGTIISCLFTAVTAMAGEIFFGQVYGSVLPLRTQGNILLVLLFSSCMNSGILLCFAKNLKNTTTFSTFANLYGTVIGFLAGTYLPYSFYPGWLKPILLWFPPTQFTSILRREYISVLQNRLERGSGPGSLQSLYLNFGLNLEGRNGILTPSRQWSILVTALVFLLLYLWICSGMGSGKRDRRRCLQD